MTNIIKTQGSDDNPIAAVESSHASISFNNVRVMKQLGELILAGRFETAAGKTIKAGEKLFQLPEGFAPQFEYKRLFLCDNLKGTCSCTINPKGEVLYETGAAELVGEQSVGVQISIPLR